MRLQSLVNEACTSQKTMFFDLVAKIANRQGALEMRWIAFTLLVSLAGAAQAQAGLSPKKNSPVKKPQITNSTKTPVSIRRPAPVKAPPAKFSMRMLESGKFDPAYNGLAAADVIKAIEGLSVGNKGDFESTADYNTRKSAALSRSFLGGTTVNDVFAFVAPVDKHSGCSDDVAYGFNADTGDVSLYALPQSSEYSSLNGIGAPDYSIGRRQFKGLDQFDLSSKIVSQKTYKGSNAYGATTLIEATIMNKVGIAAVRIPFINFERETIYCKPTPIVQFKMDSSTAAAELPNLKALFVMRLSEPYVIYNFFHKEPKRDSPTEISIQEKFLAGEILGIVYFSGRTGKIFARLPADFGIKDSRNEATANDRPSSE